MIIFSDGANTTDSTDKSTQSTAHPTRRNIKQTTADQLNQLGTTATIRHSGHIYNNLEMFETA